MTKPMDPPAPGWPKLRGFGPSGMKVVPQHEAQAEAHRHLPEHRVGPERLLLQCPLDRLLAEDVYPVEGPATR